MAGFLGFTGQQTVLLLFFVLIWTSRSLVVRASRVEGGGYLWNVTSIVIATEFVKLLIALGMFFYGGGTMKTIQESASKGIYFAIPGFMYAWLNNLAYLVLNAMDAGTYYVLYNLRILISGLITQIIFGKPLGKLKWLALCLLVLGCVIHQWSEKFTIDRLWPLALLCIQCFLSSLSGVYNEYLLKKDAKDDVNLQNAWLYVFTILFGVAFVGYSEPSLLVDYEEFFRLSFPAVCTYASLKTLALTRGYLTYWCLVVILLTAVGGVVVAQVLKQLSAIMKEYGTTLVMLASTLGTSFILKERPLQINQVLSIVVVSVSLYLFNYDKIYPASGPSQVKPKDPVIVVEDLEANQRK